MSLIEDVIANYFNVRDANRVRWEGDRLYLMLDPQRFYWEYIGERHAIEEHFKETRIINFQRGQEK